MTTNNKKKALREAGVKVRSNASDETINELYEAHLAESSVGGETVSVEVEGPQDLSGSGITWVKGADKLAAFNAFLEAHQDPMMGDKTPIVIEWARKNLSRAEYEARYAGRTLPI